MSYEDRINKIWGIEKRKSGADVAEKLFGKVMDAIQEAVQAAEEGRRRILRANREDRAGVDIAADEDMLGLAESLRGVYTEANRAYERHSIGRY